MTRDDIIRLMIEAGGVEGEEVDEHLQPIENSMFVEFSENQLKTFVALIETAEREACAKVCDGWVSSGFHPASVIANAIRARSE